MAVFFAAAFGRLFPHVTAAVNRGVGVTATRDALRAGGMRFGNVAFSQVYAKALEVATVRKLEIGANLAAKPHAARIVRGPWGFARKYNQVVKLRLRDRETGALIIWDVSVVTDALKTRLGAIDDALNLVVPSLDKYKLELIGATYDHTKGRA